MFFTFLFFSTKNILDLKKRKYKGWSSPLTHYYHIEKFRLRIPKSFETFFAKNNGPLGACVVTIPKTSKLRISTIKWYHVFLRYNRYMTVSCRLSPNFANKNVCIYIHTSQIWPSAHKQHYLICAIKLPL